MSDYENLGRSRLIAEIERLQSFKTAYMEWSEKTDWVQDSVEACELGKHRADAIRIRFDKLKAENESLRKDAARFAYIEQDADSGMSKIYGDDWISVIDAAISSLENH